MAVKQPPVVSIVMPAYRAAGFISRAVDSVRAQTLTAWELLVVDDCSPDDTAAVVETLAAAEPRIRLLRLKRNGGPAAARNAGIDAARSTWIALLDADDAYTPDRLRQLVDHGEAHGLDMVADNQLLVDAASGQTVRAALAMDAAVPLTMASLFRNDLPGRSFYLGLLKPLIRRSFLQDSGVRYDTAYRYGEDFLFYAELLARGAKAALVPTPGYLYTLPGSETSGQASGMSQSRIDLNQIRTATRAFIDTHGPALDPAARLAAERRLRLLGDNQLLKDAMGQLKNRDLQGLLRSVTCHGLLWHGQTWYRLATALWARALRQPRTSLRIR